MRLESRVAVVTGASGGIGRAVALAFAEEGTKLVVHYKESAEAASEIVREITTRGGQAVAVQADVSREDDVARLAREALERFGRVDVWVNIAGADILTGEGAALSDVEKLDYLLAVDLRGTVLCSWEAARAMADGGIIINMSWDRALAGRAGRESELFSAVKGGIVGFSKSLALSLAPGIRVNVLAPGWIATSFSESLGEARRREIAESTPLKRWGTTADVASAAVFLASPGASYMTGQVLLIGGGDVMCGS